MHSVMAVEKCNNDGQIMAQMFVIEQPKQTEALFTLVSIPKRSFNNYNNCKTLQKKTRGDEEGEEGEQ